MSNVSVQPVTLLSAFRYALGRESYIVRPVADDIVANRTVLEPDHRKRIRQDIDNAIVNNVAGAAHDVDTWREVREAMA